MALQISGLTHDYGRGSVLRNVDLVVHPKEFVVVLGASGSGKTTLLRCIAGLETPTKGNIKIGDESVVDKGTSMVSVEARQIGMLFQDYALFQNLTVAKNIGFGLKEKESGVIRDWLSRIGLSDCGDCMPGNLSGGEQQRIALARALAPGPTLLLLDEPFASVDTQRRFLLAQELKQLTRTTGSAVVMVTHDTDTAFSLADKLVVLSTDESQQSVAQYDVPHKIWSEPNSPEVAGLTGEYTLLSGKVEGNSAMTPAGAIPLQKPMTGSVQVVCRTGNWQFQPQESGKDQVIESVFLGTHTCVSVETTWGLCRFHCEPEQAPIVGKRGMLTPRSPCWAWSAEP